MRRRLCPYVYNSAMNRRRLVPITGVVAALVAITLAAAYAVFSQRTANDSVADIPGQRLSQETAETPASVPAKPARTPTATISGVEGRLAQGTVTIITTSEGTFIRLEDDFTSSTAAPDNRVYLGNANGFQVEIAKLKAPSGAQNFAVPMDIDANDYTYIWIHCKAFNQTYGKGEIKS